MGRSGIGGGRHDFDPRLYRRGARGDRRLLCLLGLAQARQADLVAPARHRGLRLDLARVLDPVREVGGRVREAARQVALQREVVERQAVSA